MSSATTPELRWHAVGRRKTSVARVYLTPGSGKWKVNGRTLGDYFPRPSLVSHIQQPFTVTDTLGAFDVRGRVTGGGVTGQAGAMRLGIARALVLADGRWFEQVAVEGSDSNVRVAQDEIVRHRAEAGVVGEHNFAIGDSYERRATGHTDINAEVQPLTGTVPGGAEIVRADGVPVGLAEQPGGRASRQGDGEGQRFGDLLSSGGG